jgi:hypothetical protein
MVSFRDDAGNFAPKNGMPPDMRSSLLPAKGI